MASLLRQIVAGPRAKHQETGLDLCYVTDNIIVTSGPSQTYPQRAYRNPLDRLVAFLDAKHPDNWAIWEFRAEGTGYPDEAVYGRVRHYPWPDHHPPPFRLVPMIVASMRNWLHGEDEDMAEGNGAKPKEGHAKNQVQAKEGDNKRVVVVHCKAGKGRSGTVTCSYLISQCGWTPEDALAKFTAKRMRPQFGAGVSIPSQLRTISYVDRWTKGGKKYVDREIEITEVHVWGLRHGVKVSVEGFADEGKKIKVLHTFSKKERHVVQGDAPGGGGVMDFLGDALSPAGEDDEIYEDADYDNIVDGDKTNPTDSNKKQSTPAQSKSKKDSRTSLLLRNRSVKKLAGNQKSKTINPVDFAKPSSDTSTPTSGQSTVTLPNPDTSRPTLADTAEPGGMAVIFKPSTPIRVPSSDIKVSLERRNRTPAYMGLTMVTAVAHVWFNTFFEGNGPENDGKADDSGVFEIEWEKMDGLKGSSRKGTKAADRISVVWRAATSQTGTTSAPGVVIMEPGEGSPVPQMRPADWKGADEEDPDQKRKLGLRPADSGSEGVSRASSLRSEELGSSVVGGGTAGVDAKDSDDDSLKGVKSDLTPGSDTESVGPRGRSSLNSGQEGEGTRTLSEHEKKVEATKGHTENPDEASGAVKSQEELSKAGHSGLRGGEGALGGGPQIINNDSAKTQSLADEKDGEGREESGHPVGGDTTHLGFVKRGKKLVPMHGHGDGTEDGAGEAPKETDDHRVMHASVMK
ncbi:Telomerase protein component 1 [Gnomoniopsis sp. IMI 355080]|nr:Telomerase protein component 1 [Gnomoniopsis sp. IMI 355080]